MRGLKLPQESRIYGIKDLWIKRLEGLWIRGREITDVRSKRGEG